MADSVITKARTMRQLLRDRRPLVSPGVYDGYSALLVAAMGFETAGVWARRSRTRSSGSPTSASCPCARTSMRAGTWPAASRSH